MEPANQPPAQEPSTPFASQPASWRRWIGIVAAVAVVIGIGFWLAWPSLVHPAASGRTVPMVAGENFWGNIASQLGGSRVQVTSIISDPNADPHLYESDAHDALDVADAKIVIVNGLGYDDFMNKLLAASPSSNRLVLSAAQILGVSGNNPNPHLWYDIPRVPQVATQISAALIAKDPADKAYFQQNLSRFDASLQPVLKVIAEIKSRYPDAPVAYTERVPGYLLADAGLTVKTPLGFASAIEDGNDPSLADTATMESLITGHGIKVLLYNTQATGPVTEQIKALALQNHIPVVGVTETLPPSDPSYQAWQLDQANALLKALAQ